MWCAKCHADVAAEVTPDNARARCATCGTELGLAAAVRAADKTRQARELLERWSNNRVLDPYGPVVATDESAPEPARAPRPQPPPATEHSGLEAQRKHDPPSRDGSPVRARNVRVDQAHPAPPSQPGQRPVDPVPPVVERDDVQINRERLEPSIGAGRGLAVGRRVVRRDSAPAPAPGLDVQSAIRESGPLRTNWFHLAGQVLAYMGALVLTLGMALVLVGCFGGPPKVHFTPTGWLIATFGQLLLISGVITLVSSGMERTAQEVSWRLEALGEKLLRIEQAAGPTFPPPPIGSATRQAPPRRHPVRSTAGPV